MRLARLCLLLQVLGLLVADLALLRVFVAEVSVAWFVKMAAMIAAGLIAATVGLAGQIFAQPIDEQKTGSN